MSAIADEWRIASREPFFRIAAVILLLLTVLATWNGLSFAEARSGAAAADVQRAEEKRAADRQTLLDEASGRAKANPWGPSEPTKADWAAARPPGPLAALTFGREDLEPLSATVSLWLTRVDNLFRKHEFASPLSLAAGRFDAGFLFVLLAPLFILALTYNLVSEERESGRLKLELLSGPAVVKRLMLRGLLRVAPVFLSLVVVAIAGLAAGLPPGRLLLWLVAAACYLLVWSAIGLLIASLRFRTELLAVVAAGTWLLLAILVPAGVMAAARGVAPTPSAFETINAAREAEVVANRRLMENLDAYANDHPELASGSFTEDDWAAKLYVAHLTIERDVMPVWRDHEEAEARQADVVDTLRFLSPTLLVDAAMTDVAGTGHRRQAAFEEQARAFLRHWRNALGPKVFARQRLTADDIPRLPRFAFAEPTLPMGKIGVSLGLLGLLALVLMWLSGRRISASLRKA